MLIDSHAHLDMEDFDNDRDMVLERAAKGGVKRVISVGIDHKSSNDALRIAHLHDGVYATVGCHPHNAGVEEDRDLDNLVRLAPDPKVVAWGEIGLDFFRRRTPPEAQLKTFSHQLEIAREVRLPVIIHDRDAHEEILALLKKMGKGKRQGVIHCFSGDLSQAMALIDLGYYISIPGTVTYKNAEQVRRVASGIPLDAMLVETDAPFLAPVPKRGKRNEPLFVTYTAAEIARLRKMDFEELARQTFENTCVLFDLPAVS